MSIVTKLLCKLYALNDARRDAGLVFSQNVDRKEYVYGKEGQTLEILKMEGDRPTILNVHGGAFIYGDANLYRFYNAALVLKGYNVVAVNYRLAPKYRYPTQLFDLNEAVRWLLDNAHEMGISMRNVYLVGDSAGAQIASQYAAVCTSKAYAELLKIDVPDFVPTALGLNCGVYTNDTDNSQIKFISKYYLPKDVSLHIGMNFFDYITDEYPPTHQLSALGDFLFENNVEFHEVLESKSVECELNVSFGGKKTKHVFHLDLRNRYFDKANDSQLDFFKRHQK